MCGDGMHPALEKSVGHMQEDELCELKAALERASLKLYPPLTQLPGKGEVTGFAGEEYII